MDDGQVVTFCYLVHKYLKNKRCQKRRWWVHPLNSERHVHGHFFTLLPRLKADPETFFNYFRMSVRSYYELLHCIKDHIAQKDTNMRKAISAEEMLAFTLRYLASGCSLKDIHFNYRIGRSTASKIIRRVCTLIWEVMKNEYIPEPDESGWKNIAEGFYDRANFPNCIGTVDGKHIRVIKPAGSGSSYMNYKHFFSIVLLAIADTNYSFIYVDVGSFGKDSDSTIFNNSSLWRKLENKTLNLPKPSFVPGIEFPLPFAFVADEAFGLSPNLLRPYSGRQLTQHKRVFNDRLSRARRHIECTFGIMSNKWRILHRPIDVDIDFGVDIVKCLCVLHNFVRKNDGYNSEDTLTIVGFEDVDHNNCNINVNRSVNRYRDALANYFISNIGELPWQYDRI